ncbi:MAG: hypothetical protein ACLFPJ_05245 [Candidatus Woesearchaeota archaeon]
MNHEKNHFYLSSLLIMIGFFCLFVLVITPTNDTKMSAMVTKDTNQNVFCEFNTPLGECSIESIGNKCVMSKHGPRLEMAKECYENYY